MTKPAAEEWQAYDPEKPPEVGRWFIYTAGTDFRATVFNDNEPWIKGKWEGCTSWAYINPPEPELQPCALHPDIKPVLHRRKDGFISCSPEGEPTCCRMPNAELWNEMQEWLKEKMDD